MIFETAARTDGVGEIEEALRWGQPSYLTPATGSGSTVRIGPVKGAEDRFALYVTCQTTLVSTFRSTYPDLFVYSGDRAIEFRAGDRLRREELGHCIALALRYHLDKKRELRVGA